VLELTENEAHCIKDDKRFRPFKGEKPEQRDQLEKQNDPETVKRAALSEKSPEQLRALCVEMEKKGFAIEYRGGATKGALIAAILNAERAGAVGQPPTEPKAAE
jgi:hypothetical protein